MRLRESFGFALKRRCVIINNRRIEAELKTFTGFKIRYAARSIRASDYNDMRC